MPRRTVLFFAIGLATGLLFWPALKPAVNLALHNDRYLQVLLAPLVCSFLIFLERKPIFSEARYSPRDGLLLLSFAILLGCVCVFAKLALPFAVLALVLTWMAAFLLCYGPRSFRLSLYPLCCLFLMAPPPAAWMNWIAAGLQQGSAAVSYEILRLSGIPIFRRGMLFSLPGLDFEIAPECSGIHSSLALLVIAIVAGYVYLRTGWARSVLILLTIPIALFKNAVRIVSISTLGAYVNRAFLDGPFHHQYGGLLFSVVGVVLFVLVLAGLRYLEDWRPDRSAGQTLPGASLLRS